jgi:hypothetical protein
MIAPLAGHFSAHLTRVRHRALLVDVPDVTPQLPLAFELLPAHRTLLIADIAVLLQMLIQFRPILRGEGANFARKLPLEMKSNHVSRQHALLRVREVAQVARECRQNRVRPVNDQVIAQESAGEVIPSAVKAEEDFVLGMGVTDVSVERHQVPAKFRANHAGKFEERLVLLGHVIEEGGVVGEVLQAGLA